MKKYTILKNWHYAFFLLGRLFGWSYNKTEFNMKFEFSKECWWTPSRNADDYDLNKLCGISFGLLGIHKNSVRLAWVPDFSKKGVIKIYGYTYDSVGKSEHKSLYICDVNVDTTYDAKIVCKDDKYLISVGSTEIEMDNKIKDNKIQKEDYPYFGGNNRSPQKMYIWTSVK